MSNPALFAALKSKFGTVKGSGDWLRIPCPTCDPHNRKKMKRSVPSHGYTSNCFICGVKMNVADLLDGYYIPKSSDIKDIDFDEEKEVNPLSLILPYTKGIPVNELSADHPAIKFLNKDHLYDLDTYANVHKIVYVPFEGGITFHNSSKFITSAERIVFPVYFEAKLVGWQMRTIPDTFYGDREDAVRYYHLFNKGSYLYNYDQAKAHDRVIVVEGVKKALKFPNAVATLGTGISRRQLKLIQNWKEIIFMLDADVGKEKNNTQTRAKDFVTNINVGGASKAINVNLADYGADSPDDLPSSILHMIVEEQWNEQTHH